VAISFDLDQGLHGEGGHLTSPAIKGSSHVLCTADKVEGQATNKGLVGTKPYLVKKRVATKAIGPQGAGRRKI
jgi:hypothetical protein